MGVMYIIRCFKLVLLISLLINVIVARAGGSTPWLHHLRHLRSSVSQEMQQDTVRNMLKRLLPNDHQKFYLTVGATSDKEVKDFFKISSPLAANDSRVGITGTSGVATALGVMHYLKYYCNSHVSWEASHLHIPYPLPTCQVKIKTLDQFRYYQNVCTLSYSFAWWKWERWERHIDWMALNGINLPLAFVGQEAIWSRVYSRFNFTQQDLDQHFAGPAFLAWGRMGNIQKWGGPLTDTWHQQTLALQHKILERMRRFGMIPILPAFAGHVPSAITRVYPDAQVTRLPAWSKFTSDNYTRTFFLHPNDPLFSRIGSEFIKEMQREFNGTDHIYNCDPFNEMVPSSRSPEYIRSVSKSIFKAMTKGDKRAIWVLQGWMFHNPFWTYDIAKAFITAVPQGRMIVLDLDAEVAPLYDRYDSFFGQPFIFCLLSNYGGVDGLFGNMQLLTENVATARNHSNSSLVGIGLTPEGINQNYVIYDYMLELGWRQPYVNISLWAEDYASRRYGSSDPSVKEAWHLLIKSVYNCTSPLRYHGQGILIQHRPDFLRKTNIWYDRDDLFRAWTLLVGMTGRQANIYGQTGTVRNFTSSGNAILASDTTLHETDTESVSDTTLIESAIWKQETYQHDLIDVGRQVLQVIGDDLILRMRDQFNAGSISGVNATGALLEELLNDLDYMLGTSKAFSLETWVRGAIQWATNKQEKYQYISNALYQISLWGPNGEILDYAVKQWNGVIRNYLKPRWVMFKEVLISCLEGKKKFVQDDFNTKVFQAVERPFAQGHFAYRPKSKKDDFVKVVQRLVKKYRPFETVTAEEYRNLEV